MSDNRQTFVFADEFNRYHFRSPSIADAYAAARNVSTRVRLVEIDGRRVTKLEAYAAAHYVADVRRVGDRLRVACDCVTADGAACSAVEFIPPTFAALRALLGY